MKRIVVLLLAAFLVNINVCCKDLHRPSSRNVDSVQAVETDSSNDHPSQDRDNKNKNKSFPNLSFITAILALAFSIYLFSELNKLKNDVQAKFKRRKEAHVLLENKMSKFENDLEKNRGVITELKRQMAESVSHIKESQSNTVSENSHMDIPQPSDSVNKKQEKRPSELYCGAPVSSCFEVSESYYPGALYKIVVNGSGTGDFEFVDSIEALECAQMSRTSFLEPACNVINNDIARFDHIYTERNGKVKKTNDGWVIVEKAVVRLV
ncbi:MAG: hypothetical protein IJU81_01290 [Bacteroidales bacterium]|nr:hypothetical protein [Bacteroidales bacterium]